MKPDTLESFVRAVTTLMVLSLGVERIAEIFKKRDWQPFSRGPRVDLRSGKLERGRSKALAATDVRAIDDNPTALRRVKRSAHAENTILIGIVLAFLTGTNAFAHLVPPFAFLGKLAIVQQVFQLMLTGAAAGLGSSFWYDVLGLVAEARRVREQATTNLAAATPALNIPPLLKAGSVPQPPA